MQSQLATASVAVLVPRGAVPLVVACFWLDHGWAQWLSAGIFVVACVTDWFDGYFARHRVKPGITGWAQINGWRGELTSPDKIKHRVEHDLYYIENWSLLLDISILARTPLSLLKSQNAY